MNWYAYVGNDPVNAKDPTGKDRWEIDQAHRNHEINPSQTGKVLKATGEFIKNYKDMRDANTIEADKYFHCKANCEATLSGEAGEETAEVISDSREWVDQNIKGDSLSASEDDQKANELGRKEGKNMRENTQNQNKITPKSCSDACSSVRPIALDKKY